MLDKKLLQGIFIGIFVSFAFFSLIASESLQTNQALERHVSTLENRVTQLERISQPSQRQASPLTTNQWRRLENDMTMTQVRRIFGEPDRVVNIGNSTTWHFGRGTVSFWDQKVNEWREP